jgi:hypothetical protein
MRRAALPILAATALAAGAPAHARAEKGPSLLETALAGALRDVRDAAFATRRAYDDPHGYANIGCPDLPEEQWTAPSGGCRRAGRRSPTGSSARCIDQPWKLVERRSCADCSRALGASGSNHSYGRKNCARDPNPET